MLGLAREIKAVARPQLEFLTGQYDVQPAAHQIEELLAFVRIGIAAARAGSYAKQVRLHRDLARRQQFHLNAGTALQTFAIGRPHQRPSAIDGSEQVQNIEAVILRQLAHDADGGTALRPFKVAEESNGDPRRVSPRGEQLAALEGQLAETGTDGRLFFRRTRGAMVEQPLLLQLIQDGRSVQALHAPQVNGSAQDADIVIGIETILALV